MSSPASYSPSSVHSGGGQDSPRVGGSSSARALAVVTNRWYREQRRADQEATRTLTLLKQRKISCILKVESLQRGLGRDSEGVEVVEKELEDVEQKMIELEREREARCRKIMDRRVQQVTTLQELGLLEAAGKESIKWHSESDLKNELEPGGDEDLSVSGEHNNRRSKVFGDIFGISPYLGQSHSPATASTASSQSSHTGSRKLSPTLLAARLRAGSDPSICRPDSASKLEPGSTDKQVGKGITAKLSPRLGRRNPLRMLSNAIDFRSRRKQRPKSADFEKVEGGVDESAKPPQIPGLYHLPPTPRSASVTDILESVRLSPGPRNAALPFKGGRILEGRNSAPDMLVAPGGLRAPRLRPNSRLSAAATAKQKLSTRFQPQRKQHHRTFVSGNSNSSIKRAKTFSLGGPGPSPQKTTNYKTLPKQASSRSLGSSSTDSSTTGSQSTTSSRKSSDSSNVSENGISKEISKDALEEIAAFEKFIDEYFETCDNNNLMPTSSLVLGDLRAKKKSSTTSILSEVLELTI